MGMESDCLRRTARVFAPVLLAAADQGRVLAAQGRGDGQGTWSVVPLLRDVLHGIWNDFVAHIPYVAAALVVLALTWLASVLFSRVLGRVLDRARLRASLRELADRFASIVIWVAGILVAAMIVFPGLTPAKALGAMGIASIAVGFAFKDIFENFFAGVLILWRFPFENGDIIACQDITGEVVRVTVRMTEIRLPSGELVVLPNSILFKNPVEIITAPSRRRIAIVVGVAYGASVADAVKVIEKAVRDCASVDSDKAVQVFPQAFGASSIDIETAWWTGAGLLDERRSRGEVLTAIKSALDEAGIEIPFPYRTLTFKEPLQTRSAD